MSVVTTLPVSSLPRSSRASESASEISNPPALVYLRRVRVGTGHGEFRHEMVTSHEGRYIVAPLTRKQMLSLNADLAMYLAEMG